MHLLLLGPFSNKHVGIFRWFVSETSVILRGSRISAEPFKTNDPLCLSNGETSTPSTWLNPSPRHPGPRPGPSSQDKMSLLRLAATSWRQVAEVIFNKREQSKLGGHLPSSQTYRPCSSKVNTWCVTPVTTNDLYQINIHMSKVIC